MQFLKVKKFEDDYESGDWQPSNDEEAELDNEDKDLDFELNDEDKDLDFDLDEGDSDSER